MMKSSAGEAVLVSPEDYPIAKSEQYPLRW